MTQAPQQLTTPTSRSLVPAALTLGIWQIKQTWRIITLMGIGLIIVVVLIGAMPLFSHIVINTGLRNFLNETPSDLDITLSNSQTFTARSLYDIQFARVTSFVPAIAPYLTTARPTALHLAGNTVLVKGHAGTLAPTGNAFTFNGVPLDYVTPQVQVLQGRLPDPNSPDIEVAVAPDVLSILNLTVGAVVPLRVTNVYDANKDVVIQMHIVGVVSAPPGTPSATPFWQANDMRTIADDSGKAFTFKALLPQSRLLALVSTLVSTFHADTSTADFPLQVDTYWFYRIDPTRIDANQLDVVNNLLGNFFTNENAITHVTGAIFAAANPLTNYSARITNAQIPLIMLSVGLIAIAVFFASLLAEILVDRQSDAIAVLRGRGFSRLQILGALIMQGLGLGAIVLGLGMLLAGPVALLIAHLAIPAAQQRLLAVPAGGPFQTSSATLTYALLTVGCLILAFLFAVIRAAQLNILSLRHEAARNTRPPLWQRLNLDIVAVLILLIGIGLTRYINETVAGVDPQIDRLLSPLALLAPVFFVLAAIFVLLRFFAWLVRRGEFLAGRGRGALALVGLAQLARSPRQAIRMITLLSLALIFTIFLFSFTATQQQRTYDIAAYQAAADFSGQSNIYTINTPPLSTSQQIAKETAAFTKLPGVTAVSLGHTETLHTIPPTPLQIGLGTYTPPPTENITVNSVDADTYAKVAVWPTLASSLSVADLMARLRAGRASLTSDTSAIPAIVDAKTYADLHLTNGETFALSPMGFGDYDEYSFRVIAVVASIPQTPVGQGGILVDYPTYDEVFRLANQTPLHLDNYCLRTVSDPSTLRQLRAILGANTIVNSGYADRRAFIAQLQNDPLFLTIVSLLAICVAVALLLAIFGALIASWVQVGRQLTGFAVLRALGATPRQLTRIILWQQVVVYVMAIALGAGLGWVLSISAVPDLIFSNIATITTAPANPFAPSTQLSGASFYQLQNTPAIQLVFPSTALWLLVGVIVLGALALGLMTVLASRPSISQTLRLNED